MTCWYISQDLLCNFSKYLCHIRYWSSFLSENTTCIQSLYMHACMLGIRISWKRKIFCLPESRIRRKWLWFPRRLQLSAVNQYRAARSQLCALWSIGLWMSQLNFNLFDGILLPIVAAIYFAWSTEKSFCLQFGLPASSFLFNLIILLY